MDTVEWGSVEPTRRRSPNRMSSTYLAALVLAVIGFGLLMAAELNPWAAAQADGSTGPSASQLTIGLEVLGSASGITYHLGLLAVLGAVGLVLASPAGRRRGPLGIAVGLAAGQLLVVVQEMQTLHHTLEGTVPGQAPGADTVLASLQVSFRSGVYLAVAGVLVLAAAAVLGTVRWRDLAAHASRATAGPVAPEEDRELTVTALEPLNEAHFAQE